MTQETLTTEEINILMEALESWENKEVAGFIMRHVLSSMMIPKDAPEEQISKFENEIKSRERREEMEKKERKDTSLLLRAKLIQIRNSIVVEEANGYVKVLT